MSGRVDMRRLELARWLDTVTPKAYGWPESLVFTYTTAERLMLEDGVRGDFVECGVGNGAHPAVMARACDDVGDLTRVVRLFDSFQGVPHGSTPDAEWNAHYGDGSGRLEPTGVAACSLDDVKANLAAWGLEPEGERFRFHPGWFQDTVPLLAKTLTQMRVEGRWDGIAFLRLDGDLYESTLTCLVHLYPLLNSGGVLCVDDYNLDGCREALIAYFNDMGAPYGAGPGRRIPRWTPITESGDVYWVKP